MAKMFQDNDGNTSSMRMVWAIMCFGFLAIWGYLCVVNRELQNLQVGDALFMGAMFGSKAAQKYFEKKPDDTGNSVGYE